MGARQLQVYEFKSDVKPLFLDKTVWRSVEVDTKESKQLDDPVNYYKFQLHCISFFMINRNTILLHVHTLLKNLKRGELILFI